MSYFALRPLQYRLFSAAVARLCLFLLALGSVACSSAPDVEVSEWTLTVEGRSYPVTAPGHFGRELPEHDTRYVLEATVPLPPAMRGRALTLAIVHFPALVSLDVDGVTMMALDTSSTDVYRSDGFWRWQVPASATDLAALHLVLGVDHRWTQSGWLDATPRLSATARGDRWFLFVRNFNTSAATIAMGAAIFTFFSYAFVFLFDRQRVAQGWFALQALTAAPYCLFQLGLTQPLLGVYDAPAMAILLLVAMFSSVRFTHAHLHLTGRTRVWDLLLLPGIAVGLIASGPFLMTRYFAPVVVASVALQVVYQVVMLARLQRRGQGSVNARFLFVSWAQLGVAGAVDFAAWLGLGEAAGGLRFGCVGITVFAVGQSAVLSRDYILSLRNADALNAELADRLQTLEERSGEVRLLNAELRRQIASRSEQLALALARAGTAPLPPHLEPGDVVDGRFEVVRAVGAGGMGEVFEVSRLADGRRLALKVLTGATGTVDYARFAREAQLATQVEHPAVVGVVDFHVSLDGAFFLVMEYVEGTSLRDERPRYGDVAWALSVLQGVAAGLAAIHALDIVHRDLKPANILLAGDSGGEPEGRVKIADFGISTLVATSVPPGPPAAPPSANTSDLGSPPQPRGPASRALASQGSCDGADDDDGLATSTLAVPIDQASPLPAATSGSTPGNLTLAGTILGTPLYMPPELARPGAPARPSADMFSFGVIAYEILTRRLPFPAPLAAARLAGRSVVPPAPVGHYCSGLDASTAKLVMLCLSEDADSRPTAAEIVSHLRERHRIAETV